MMTTATGGGGQENKNREKSEPRYKEIGDELRTQIAVALTAWPRTAVRARIDAALRNESRNSAQGIGWLGADGLGL